VPHDTDGLVGKLALQKGLLTAAQLKECLAEQAALRKAGQKRPLGVLLVSRGILTDDALLGLLEEQRRHLAERATYAQVRKEDFLFGQILLRQGVASSDEINAALRAQAEAAERGEVPVPRLGQILIERGVSDERVIHETLKLQYKTLFQCPGCGLRYNLKDVELEKEYRCRKCGQILEPARPDLDVRADESAYGPRLEVAEDDPPEVAAAERDPANRFDKYVLLEQIGRGGAGTVYKAYQKDLKRIVALKVLRGEDPEMMERFTREAQTAARLRHPGIVAIYEIGRFHNVPFLAMEHVDGRPLDQLGRLPFRRAAQVLRDVAAAVEAAHRGGVIHRDLKPANILIDSDGRVAVTDFGLARPLSGARSLTEKGIVVGTPAYMSPEQAAGERDLDGRTDVASLGSVLYELLTGQSPYVAATPVDVALAVIHRAPVPPRRVNPEVPAELEAVCLKALEKDRNRRYLTARAFAEDLQRYLEGEPVLARPAGPVRDTLRRVVRLRPASLVAVSALLVAAVALGVLSTVLGQSRAKDRILRGRDLEQKGRLEEALRIYEVLPDARADAERVRAAVRRREQERALEARWKEAEAILAGVDPRKDPARRIELATQALEKFPDYEEAFVVRAAARREAGEDAAAYEDLGRAAALASTPLPHFLARAEIARRLGRLEDEVADLSRAIELSPLSADLYLYRAWASARLARESLGGEAGPEHAGRVARLFVSAEDDLSHAGRHPLRESMRAQLDGVAAAIEEGPAALRQAFSAAFAEIAYEFASAHRIAAALAAAERAAGCDPAHARAYAARALCHFAAGRFPEARVDAARALELAPSLYEARAVRGLCRVREGRAAPPDGGAADPVRVAEIADGCADLHEFLEHGGGRPGLQALEEMAREGVRAADGLDPPDRAALARALVGRGAALREARDFGCAIRVLGHAAALDPTNAAAWAERGRCRHLAGDLAAAAADWEQAGAIDPALRERLAEPIRQARERSADGR
jgi:tetratricopeptide (TPR) repeat protein